MLLTDGTQPWNDDDDELYFSVGFRINHVVINSKEKRCLPRKKWKGRNGLLVVSHMDNVQSELGVLVKQYNIFLFRSDRLMRQKAIRSRSYKKKS